VLQKAINKSHAWVSNVEQHSQSGASAENSLKQALCLLSEDQKIIFKHLRCCNILFKVTKWFSYIDNNKKKKKEAARKKQARSPSSEAPMSSAVPLDAVSEFDKNDT